MTPRRVPNQANIKETEETRRIVREYRQKAPHGLDDERIKAAHKKYLAEKAENAKKAGAAGYFRVK